MVELREAVEELVRVFYNDLEMLDGFIAADPEGFDNLYSWSMASAVRGPAIRLRLKGDKIYVYRFEALSLTDCQVAEVPEEECADWIDAMEKESEELVAVFDLNEVLSIIA